MAHHLRWRDAVDRLHIPLAVLVGVGATLVVTAGAVGAQDGGIVEIPLGTVVRADPGAEVSLNSVAVPTELVGLECSVQSRSENNSSVHPGNDLVVTSGPESVVLSDVEGSAGKVTTATATVTLGDDIAVTLIMGPDGVFSAGARAAIVLECIVPETTTTGSFGNCVRKVSNPPKPLASGSFKSSRTKSISLLARMASTAPSMLWASITVESEMAWRSVPPRASRNRGWSSTTRIFGMIESCLAARQLPQGNMRSFPL